MLLAEEFLVLGQQLLIFILISALDLAVLTKERVSLLVLVLLKVVVCFGVLVVLDVQDRKGGSDVGDSALVLDVQVLLGDDDIFLEGEDLALFGGDFVLLGREVGSS